MAAKKTAMIPAKIAKPARKRHPGGGPHTVISLAAIGVAAAAVTKELKKPADQRTWNGMVASVVPYDFRVPTVDRVKQRLWNPEGRVIGPRIFGVGWTVNWGRVVAEAKELAAAQDEETSEQ